MIALFRPIARGAGAALISGLLLNAPTLAHGPDPLLGTIPWGVDQVVGYQWMSGATPPSWMASAIDAGAADVGRSKNSRAATFVRVSASNSQIAYGGGVPCSSYGIACMNRSGVPDSFNGMWFRPYGWAFDWGTLRWCQGQTTPTNGCYDAENVALDEFGHIEMLGHHVNLEDESDFQDAVVQFAARSKPKAGWDDHALGRCDVARLQLEYALESSADRISTCNSLATSLSVVASATTINAGSSVRITGTFKVAVTSAARSLSGDPLSGRSITLQRRLPGATAWSTFGTLTGNSTAGSYGLTLTPSTTYDYRLLYAAATAEGLLGATSSTVRVAVIACPTTPVRGVIRQSPCL